MSQGPSFFATTGSTLGSNNADTSRHVPLYIEVKIESDSPRRQRGFAPTIARPEIRPNDRTWKR